jgi:hypothetical protein
MFGTPDGFDADPYRNARAKPAIACKNNRLAKNGAFRPAAALLAIADTGEGPESKSLRAKEKPVLASANTCGDYSPPFLKLAGSSSWRPSRE